jgi:ankyrin repeat protein
MTALMITSYNGPKETVALLLRKGANNDATNKVRIPQHITMFQSMSS